MAEVTLNPDPQSFPIGTKVKVKRAPAVGGQLHGEPTGTLVTEPEVTSAGTLTVAGVQEGVSYVAWAQVGGADRYLSFTPRGSSGGAGVKETAGLDTITNTEPGRLLRIHAINFDIQTSAQVGKRYVGYEITNAEGHTFYESLTPAIETPSTLYGCCCFRGAVPVSAASQGIGARTINLPLPFFDLPYGWVLKLINVGKQSEDTFPLLRILYEYVGASAALQS